MLHIPKISVSTIEQGFQEIKEKTTSFILESVNWSNEFPYKPQVKVHVAYSEKGVFLRYDVKEQQCRAEQTSMWAKVFTDSCVEFFVSLDGGESYFNFEFNAVGSRDVSYRNPSKDIKYKLEDTLLEQIQILSTYPKFEKVNEKPAEWTLQVFIPFEVMGVERFKGLNVSGNFYKCGDDLDEPHYVSYFPIETERPNFHCPDFFGKLTFEK